MCQCQEFAQHRRVVSGVLVEHQCLSGSIKLLVEVSLKNEHALFLLALEFLQFLFRMISIPETMIFKVESKSLANRCYLAKGDKTLAYRCYLLRSSQGSSISNFECGILWVLFFVECWGWLVDWAYNVSACTFFPRNLGGLTMGFPGVGVSWYYRMI